MVVKLEDMYGKGSMGTDSTVATQRVMNSVFDHVGLERETLSDPSAKNSREYVALKDSGEENLAAAQRLKAFYEPFSACLCDLLGDSEFTSAWG